MDKLADIQLLSNNRLVILDQIHCLNMQKILPLTLDLLFQPSVEPLSYIHHLTFSGIIGI